jgi:N4-gp56 family major capsid protein
MGITATDVISDDDVRAVLEERTQEMYQFRRAYRNHDGTDLDSGRFSFPQADDNVRDAMDEVAEEAGYPRAELNYSNVTANYTKDGFEVAISDEAVSDSVFDVIMDVTEEMAIGAESILDSRAWSLMDPNGGANLNGEGPIGTDTNDLDYAAVVNAYTTLLDDEFRPQDFELFLSPDAFGDLAKDDNFTHATDQGDQTVRQGTLQVGFGVPLIPTNTGDLAEDEAIMVDTGLYGYESTRWNREVTNYREERHDRDVFKIRHRKDFVVMKSDAAIYLQGGV